MAILRREVASLQAALKAKPATIDPEEVAAREAAKRKRIEDRQTAKQEYAEAVAKQALLQPERDRARAEWLAKEAARKREQKRLLVRKWSATNPEKAKAIKDRWNAANPEKVRAIQDRYNQRRKERRATRKQIEARPDLLGGSS